MMALPKITIAEKINSIDWSLVNPVSKRTNPMRPKIKGTEYLLANISVFELQRLLKNRRCESDNKREPRSIKK
jgi:hypothetical protein